MHKLAIITRADARAKGLTRYYSGMPCKHGHLTERYVAGWVCIGCLDIIHKGYLKNPDLKPKTVARLAGEATYVSEGKCRNGHSSVRHTHNGRCVVCSAGHRNRKKARDAAKEKVCKRVARPLRPKAVAIAAGGEFYSTGKPCSRGHEAHRRVSDGMCILCVGMAATDWARRHPERARAAVIRRRARIKGASGSHTPEQLLALLSSQAGKCIYCRSAMGQKWTVDHINAISKGGSNDIANIQLLCLSCNQHKSAKNPLDFAREMGILT